MKWLKGFVLRLAARINPALGKLLRDGGTLDRLTPDLTLHRERHSSDNREILSRLDEMRQAQAMSGAGPMLLEGARSSAKRARRSGVRKRWNFAENGTPSTAPAAAASSSRFTFTLTH